MYSKKRFPNVILGANLRSESAALAILLMLLFLLFVLLFMTLAVQPAQAQTYKVIYNFTGGADGANPYAGLTMDAAGNLYGTASGGGNQSCLYGCGTAFKLAKKGSGWVFNPLYSFTGGSDGASPSARVVFGPDGSLYGTTFEGGESLCHPYGCGTVFNLKPGVTACKSALCPWRETVLYRFMGSSDGQNPDLGDLSFDQAGNVYGTTPAGGLYGSGTVFKLAPSNGGWTESILYNFTGGSDGADPYAGLTFDNSGNLYGTATAGGGLDAGTVFQLTPSGSGWTENVIYPFQFSNDGATPYAGLIFDRSGNLYGATSSGSGFGGTVFKLSPSNGGWTYSLIYSFAGDLGPGPVADLVMDGAGNLYGTTVDDGAHMFGSVFKLTPSNGSWTYTSLHDFTGGSDGGEPVSNLVFDASGNLYGTTFAGGAHGDGVVFEITP